MPTIRLWIRAVNAIEVLDVEEYLRGVIPSEMPASWPAQALAAQSVAARTYAMRAIEAPRHAPFADICDSAQCQAHSDAHYASTDAAVGSTAGETWPGGCLYVSRCGRPECPLCRGTGGYHDQTWTERMCQYGAKYMADAGSTWREILAHYYGGAPAEAPEDVTVTDWIRYPRPADDTGAGVHMSPGANFPMGENDGLIPGMISECRNMGLRWLKLLDQDGSSYNACRMVLLAGMMPVVRLYRTRPYPGRLTDKHRAAARELVGIGVRYFERGNEPNLDWEWQEGRWPGNDWNAWTDATFDALAADWLDDGRYLAGLGAFVAIDALSGGGNYDDILYFGNFLKALKRAGAAQFVREHAWIACHPAGLNHPIAYPEDARNQQDHPGVTILGSIAGEAPSSPSNCIRKPWKLHAMFVEAMNFEIPIMATEGGFWPHSKHDPRYPELTVQSASDMQVAVLRDMATAPIWYFASMPWCYHNRLAGNPAEHFENDAWHRIPGFGNCDRNEPADLPLLAALKANPCKERSTDVTNTQLARAKKELERVAFLDKVAKLHNLTWCGFEYAEDGQTVTLGQKAGTLDFYRVAVTTGQWTEQAARAAVPELVR